MKLPYFEIKKRSKVTLVVFVGRAKVGKSFLLNLIAEVCGLYNNKLCVLFDSDEQADRDFTRVDDVVKPMPMKCFDDIARITGQAPVGCSLILGDTAGASQGFMAEVCSNQKFLANSNLELVAVIVTPDLLEYGDLTKRWLQIFKNSPRGFLIQNELECSGSDGPGLPLPEGIEAPAEMTIMRVPHLDRIVANEISRIAVKIGDVADGRLDAKDSEILNWGPYQDMAALWANETITALAPLIRFICDTVNANAAKPASPHKPIASS
jgi:hypothetical protein